MNSLAEIMNECHKHFDQDFTEGKEETIKEENLYENDLAQFLIPSVQIELGCEDNDSLAKDILRKRCENLTFKLTQAMSLPDPTIF